MESLLALSEAILKPLLSLSPPETPQSQSIMIKYFDQSWKQLEISQKRCSVRLLVASASPWCSLFILNLIYMIAWVSENSVSKEDPPCGASNHAYDPSKKDKAGFSLQAPGISPPKQVFTNFISKIEGFRGFETSLENGEIKFHRQSCPLEVARIAGSRSYPCIVLPLWRPAPKSTPRGFIWIPPSLAPHHDSPK